MLVSIPYYSNPITNLVAIVNGNSTEVIMREIGIYEIGHFNFNHMITIKDEYPKLLGIDCYGVCDDYQQIIDQCPDIIKSNRKFVIAITPVEKKNQSCEGGWRWHKWGPYIGDQKPMHEYLYNEPKIEKIFCYHIYEV